MEKLTELIIKKRKLIIVLLILSFAASGFLVLATNVNYDLSEYLPEDSDTKKALDVMRESFGYPSMAQVMAEDVTIAQALALKAEIEAIDGVLGVNWMDDFADITVPAVFIPASLKDTYYKDGAALFYVSFENGDYSETTYRALRDIRGLYDKISISGQADSSRETSELMGPEMLRILLIVVPLCVLLLMFASSSWLEPFMYLAIIGVSIFWNMATNAFLPGVSYITHSMAAVVQLAVAMDYSLFYYHRFREERKNGAELTEAIKKASKKTIVSISASALTTIAGFLALFFMRYEIGSDFGLVLAKGIVFSFISVILLMPLAIYFFHGVFEKTGHRSFIPSLSRLGGLVVRLRYVMIPLFIVILVPAFLGQQKMQYLYGDSAATSLESPIAAEREAIAARYGESNPTVFIVPEGDSAREAAFAAELAQSRYVTRVFSLSSLVDPAIPRQMLPERVTSQFISNGYVRIIAYLGVKNETAQSEEAVGEIKTLAEKYYEDDWFVAGSTTSTYDIKETIEVDGLKVTLFSLLLVGIVVMIAFRSALIPILLVAVIEASVLINMSIPYFQGVKLIYFGYLVVSSLQLGATIDYAILMTSRYLEYRKTLMPPREAAVRSIETAGMSVTVSALIFTAAGFTEGSVSQIPSISAVGMLLGRGALLSLIMVIFVLPSLLVLLDRVIMTTTLGFGFVNKKPQPQIKVEYAERKIMK